MQISQLYYRAAYTKRMLKDKIAKLQCGSTTATPSEVKYTEREFVEQTTAIVSECEKLRVKLDKLTEEKWKSELPQLCKELKARLDACSVTDNDLTNSDRYLWLKDNRLKEFFAQHPIIGGHVPELAKDKTVDKAMDKDSTYLDPINQNAARYVWLREHGYLEAFDNTDLSASDAEEAANIGQSIDLAMGRANV